MKKITSLLVAILMSVSLVACSTAAPAPAPAPAPPSVPSPTPNEAPKETEVDWPKKPVQIIVPYNPGGDSDFNARAYAKRLEKELGQPVIVTNIAGGGGATGSRQAKESANDGNTILMYHTSMFVNQAVGATDYGLDAFEIAAIGGKNGGSVVTVNAKSPYKTLKDLMDASAAEPGKLTFAANVGATTYVMASSFNEAGAAFNLVDLGDATERVSQLMGNHVTVIPNALGTMIPYIESGDFRALAIIEDERNPLYPDIPTAIEQGYEGCSLPIYYFFAFPKGTDSKIVEKFGNALANVNKDPEYQKEIADVFQQSPYFLTKEEAEKILYAQQEDILAKKDILMKK